MAVLTILDYAAGAGMLAEGIRLACDTVGLRTQVVGYVERDSYAAAGIVAGVEAQVMDSAPLWDDARDLWPILRGAIETIEPGLAFLENVAGHVRRGYERTRRDLQRLGYRVTQGLFTAAEVGASRERKRLFILAERKGGIARESSGGDGQSDRREQTMEHVERPYARGRDAECEAGARLRRDRPTNASETLADADLQQQDPTIGRQGVVAGNDRIGVEHATSRRCDDEFAKESRLSESAGSGGSGKTGLPLFAPGPSDARWTAICKACPETQPAVRAMVDGLALRRADELRLLGNGVVPLAAAYAFCLSWHVWRLAHD